MKNVTYNSKVTVRSKGKYCFHVPKKLLDSGDLELNKEYNLTAKEAKKEVDVE